MPPKKDALAPETSIAGYDSKETRILAAAFVSSIAPDKLSGFTEGTLKKFWPPVKKKVIEQHPNFGKFIGASAVAVAATSKAPAGRKRKAAGADADADGELEPKASSTDTTDARAFEPRAKKAPAKGKRGKKAKIEESGEEVDNDEEISADGGDGMEEA